MNQRNDICVITHEIFYFTAGCLVAECSNKSLTPMYVGCCSIIKCRYIHIPAQRLQAKATNNLQSAANFTGSQS